MKVKIYRKVNMFTSAKGTDIPVLENAPDSLGYMPSETFTVFQAADVLVGVYADHNVPADEFFLMEVET